MENTSILVSENSPKSLPGASALFGNAFSFYKAHFKNIASIGLVPFVLNTVGVALSGVSPEASVLFTFLSFIAGIFALLAFFDLMQSDGNIESGVYGAYMRSTKMFFPYAWALLLQNLAVSYCGNVSLQKTYGK